MEPTRSIPRYQAPPDRAARAAIAASPLGCLPGGVVGRMTTASSAVTAGTMLHHQGDRSVHAELVVSGLVRVFVTAPGGRRLTVRYCRTGDLLGTVSLFASPHALPASSQAVTDARLLALSPAALRRAADRDVRVARALLHDASERALAFMAEIPHGAFDTVRRRIARHLLDLAVEPTGDGPAATIAQQELADAVGTVREVVVRTLRDLRRDGLLETRRDRIVLLDAERLAAEAHGTPRSRRRVWNLGP